MLYIAAQQVIATHMYWYLSSRNDGRPSGVAGDDVLGIEITHPLRPYLFKKI